MTRVPCPKSLGDPPQIMKLELLSAVRRLPQMAQMGLVLAVLLLVAGLAWLGLGGGPSASSLEMEQAAARTQATALAAAPIQGLAALRGSLKQIATRPELRAAFGSPDLEARAALAELLATGLPGILKLRLLPVGFSSIDTASHPPLTYASLTLLRGAELNRTDPPAEILLAGSLDEHLLMVQRVTDEADELIGFLHASFKREVIADWTAAWSGAGGYVELRQGLSKGPPLVLARAGGAGAPPGAPVLQSVTDSRWTIAFWSAPGADLSGARAMQTPPLLVVALAAGALAAMVAAILLILRKTWQGSPHTVVFDGAIRSILDGRHPGLERLIPGLPAGVGREPRVKRAPDNDDTDSDDITHIASAAPKPPAVPAAPPRSFTNLPHEAEGIEVQSIDEDPVTAVKGVDRHLQESSVMIDFGLFESTMENFVNPEAGGAAEVEVERVPAHIFRNYDIRGIAGEELTEDVAYAIGRALGSEAHQRGQSSVVVARDGRVSSPELASAVIQGLIDTGREVIDIGLAPSPVLYFATHYLDARTGVMVTGSHNPAAWNGFKLVLDGDILSGDAIHAIRKRINRGEYVQGNGNQVQADMTAEYIRRVSEDIPVALSNAYNIVVDAGNSVSGLVAPPLLRALGHDVIELHCEVDGAFPNHDPDPSQPANLVELVSRVMAEDADFGLAFDGDGDRLGLVTQEGEIIWADRMLMLLAEDILSRNPGAPVLFDVKCSRRLVEVIEQAGGKPVMTRTGHSLIRAEMKSTQAPLGGEFSGHIFVAERWYGFDDAFYAAARIIEILLARKQSATEAFARLKTGVSTPELRMELGPERVTSLMTAVLAKSEGKPGERTTLDGLRLDLPDGWGLVRPSTTMPGLVMRFEGTTEAALQRVQGVFRELLLAADSTLVLPF
jgi:phosphomannomutase / phosphoglucomutase